MQQFPGLNIQFSVVGSEMAGDRPGKVSFVKVFLLESDAETLDRLAALRLHDRNHQGRIDSSREKCAHGYVGDHLLRHRSLQQSMQPMSGFVFAAFKGMSHSNLSRAFGRPVGRRGGCFPIATVRQRQSQRTTGRQLKSVLIDAERRRDVPMPNQERQRTAINAASPTRMSTECLQF